jgi:hypothetical protein
VHEVDVEAGLPVLLGVGDGERTDVRYDHVETAKESADRSTHAARASASPTSTAVPATLPRSLSASSVAAT